MNSAEHHTLSERVTILETQMPTILTTLGDLVKDMNTILLQNAGMSQTLQSLVASRNVWRSPLVYISLASVAVAVAAILVK